MAKLTKKEKYIADMYVTYFGVAADTATIKEYTKFTTTKVLAEIKKDAQISQIGFSNEEVVNNTFQNIFGRNATPQELNKHLKALEKNNKINVNSIVKNAKSADKAVIKNKKDIAKFVAENGGAKLDLSKISAANKIDVKSLTSLTDLQTKLDALPDNDYTISAYDGKDFILTTSVDVGAKFVGTSKNDTFHATQDTLQAGDIINGHTGTDRLKISNNTKADKEFAGFEAKNIEVIEVTADGGKATVDLTYATEATKLVNANSSKDVIFENIQEPIKTVELVKVTQTGTTANTTEINFDVDAGLEGTADSIEVVLNNVKGTDGKAYTTIKGTYDEDKQKIETVNVKVTGTNSVIRDIDFKQTTVNIAGNKDLTIDNGATTILTDTTTIDASAFKGNLTLGRVDSALNKDVSVIGGLGNDKVSFEKGFNTNTTDATKKDSFDGGAGIDTIVLTYDQATGTTFGSLVNVEQLEVSDIADTDTIDMDNFSGVNKVIYSEGVTDGNTATIADASNDITVEVVSKALNGTLDVKLKTDTASDTVNVIVDKVNAADEFNTIKADTAETLNLTVNDNAAVVGKGALAVTNLSAQAAKTVNVTATSDLEIRAVNNPVNSVLTLLDASTSTGKLTIADLNTAAAGATIKLGSGDDTYTVGTSNGADTITLGAGKDTIIYKNVAQSNGVKFDTITDFVSGTDKINLKDAAFAGAKVSSDFVGSYNTYGDAVAALKGNKGGTESSSVFDASSNSLWVDVDGDGSLTSVDFRIKLDGVTAITAADLGFLSGNTIGLSSSNARVTLTEAVGSDKSTTDQDDTITTTYDNLKGSLINGAGGIDTLTVSGAFASTFDLDTLSPSGTGNANLTSIEKVIFNNVSGPLTLTKVKDIQELTVNGSDSALTLAATGTDALNKITVNNTNGASGSNITLSNTIATATAMTVITGAGDDIINAADAANAAKALTINSGAGKDTITVSKTASTVTTVNAGAGDDIINATAATAANDDIIDGGLGNDTLNITGAHTFGADANLVNVETITIADGANTTLVLSAQTEGFTINGNTSDDTITAGSGNDTITTGTGADKITGGKGVDTIDAGAGLDTVIVNAGDSIATVNLGNATTASSVTAFDTIAGLAAANGTVNSETLDVAGSASIYAPGAHVDSTDITVYTNNAGANTIFKSHAVTDGIVTFYSTDNNTTAITLSAANMAGAVNMLKATDLGNAGATAAFVVGTDTYVYTQSGNDAGTGDLVKLTGVAADSLITTNGTGANDLFIM